MNEAVLDVATTQVDSRTLAQAGKYLTFRLAAEEYGLEILKVREILGLMDITNVPQTPHYIRGILNLRGKIIPVMNLRLKFAMEAIEDTKQTCIIVVDVVNDERSILAGILVDSVSEVLDIENEQIEEAPEFGEGINTDFILGIGKIKDSVKLLLNIDNILEMQELSDIMRTAHPAKNDII